MLGHSVFLTTQLLKTYIHVFILISALPSFINECIPSFFFSAWLGNLRIKLALGQFTIGQFLNSMQSHAEWLSFKFLSSNNKYIYIYIYVCQQQEVFFFFMQILFIYFSIQFEKRDRHFQSVNSCQGIKRLKLRISPAR